MNKRDFLWAFFFVICAFFGLYAIYMGGMELFTLLGIVDDAPQRAQPWVFVLHAAAGGVALIAGPLQFNRRILGKNRKIHRLMGRIYVGAVWIAAVGGLWSALYFDVSVVSKVGFVILSILWFGTTAVGLLRIRRRQIRVHQEWMVRSLALSFFFVTFGFWVPGLTSTAIPYAVSYPLAVFMSWAVNLLVAEIWIQKTRPKKSPKLVRRTG